VIDQERTTVNKVVVRLVGDWIGGDPRKTKTRKLLLRRSASMSANELRGTITCTSIPKLCH